MKPLYQYIQQPITPKWDGHIHLFNSSQIIHDMYDLPINNCVGFPDIEFDNINSYKDNMLTLYRRYINKYYNKNQILLATAPTAEEAINIHKKIPKLIKGFGELKLYDSYRDQKINYKKISMVREVAKYINTLQNPIPIYIHFSLTNSKDVQKLESLLKEYPNIPILLCHCGMEEGYEDFTYNQMVLLMKNYDNLWTDITYTACDFFLEQPMRLYNLPLDRILLGSDINIKLFSKNHKNPKLECEVLYDKMLSLSRYVDNDKNLKKLFRIH